MEKYNQFKALYDEIDILISNHVTSSNTEFIKWHKKVERFLKLYYNEMSIMILSRPHLLYHCGPLVHLIVLG